MLSPRTYETIRQDARTTLLQRTGVTNVADDSRAGVLIDLPASEMADLWAALAETERNSFLSTASGVWLDAIGQLLGMTRLQDEKATTSGAEFKFYVTAPQNVDIIIPAATRVWPPDNSSLSFLTTVTTTLLAGSLEVYVPLEATSPGSYYRTGAYTLTAHSTNNAALHCTNVFPVTSGQDQETDDNFRYRISNGYQTWATGNATSLQAGLLRIPGVRDVLLFPFRRGVGSVDVMVVSYYPTVSDELLALVQEELDTRLAAYGVSARAIAPETVQVGVQGTLGFTAATSVTRAASLRQQAIQAVTTYLDNQLLGSSLYPDQLTRAVLELSQSIQEFTITLIQVNGSIQLPQTLTVEPYQRIVSDHVLLS